MNCIVSSDVFFYSNDENEAEKEEDSFLKAYHDETGEQLNFSMA